MSSMAGPSPVFSDGRTGKFTPHKLLEKQLEIFFGYSYTQRSERYCRNGKKFLLSSTWLQVTESQGAGPDLMRMIAVVEVSVKE